MQDQSLNTWVANAISTSAILAAFIGYLPGIAAGVAAIWYLVQIGESATVQRWLANRRIRRIAKLKATVLMLEARDRSALLPASKLDDRDPPEL